MKIFTDLFLWSMAKFDIYILYLYNIDIFNIKIISYTKNIIFQSDHCKTKVLHFNLTMEHLKRHI